MSTSQDDLYGRFLDPYLQQIELDRQAREQQRDQVIGEDFKLQWDRVYSDRDPAQCAERLISIVPGIELRGWDFSIPRLLGSGRAQSFISYGIAAATLVYACRRDAPSITAGLTRAFAVPNDIQLWHGTIYDELLPIVRSWTPPTTESELALILLGSRKRRSEINNQFRRGEWERTGRPKWVPPTLTENICLLMLSQLVFLQELSDAKVESVRDLRGCRSAGVSSD